MTSGQKESPHATTKPSLILIKQLSTTKYIQSSFTIVQNIGKIYIVSPTLSIIFHCFLLCFELQYCNPHIKPFWIESKIIALLCKWSHKFPKSQKLSTSGMKLYWIKLILKLPRHLDWWNVVDLLYGPFRTLSIHCLRENFKFFIHTKLSISE